MAAEYKALTRDQLKAAVLVCFRNAEELLADAQFLLVGERYARAIFIACVGLEELGKTAVALELYEGWSIPNSWPRGFWPLWRNHMLKSMYGDGYWRLNVAALEEVGADLLPEGYLTWDEYERSKWELFGRRSTARLKVKEASLYVDFVNRETSGFSLPSAIWKHDEARQFVGDLARRVEDLRERVEQVGWLDRPPYPPEEDDCIDLDQED